MPFGRVNYLQIARVLEALHDGHVVIQLDIAYVMQIEYVAQRLAQIFADAGVEISDAHRVMREKPMRHCHGHFCCRDEISSAIVMTGDLLELASPLVGPLFEMVLATASCRSNALSRSKLILTMSGRNSRANVQSAMMRSRRLQPGI